MVDNDAEPIQGEDFLIRVLYPLVEFFHPKKDVRLRERKVTLLNLIAPVKLDSFKRKE